MLEELVELSDRIVVLRDGCVHIGTLAREAFEVGTLSRMIAGRTYYPAGAISSSEQRTVLDVRNLSLTGYFSSVTFSYEPAKFQDSPG